MTDKNTLKPGTLEHEAKVVPILKEHAPLIYRKVRLRLQPATVPLTDRLATNRVSAIESLSAAQQYAIERLDITFAPVHGVSHPNVEEYSPNE